MDFNYYKHCIVPLCINTTIKTPKKLFFHVPKNKQIRKKWLQLARRDTNVSSSSRMYFCEDHFDLPNNMANYIQYQVMGSVSQLRLKPGCLPGKFDCQPDRKKRTCSSLTRPYILKKQRMMIIEECLNESVEGSIVDASNTSTRLISEGTLDINPVFSEDEEDLPGLRTGNNCFQVLIKHKFRSEATEDGPKLLDRPVPPLNSSHQFISISPLRMKSLKPFGFSISKVAIDYPIKDELRIENVDTDGKEDFEHYEMERLKLGIDEDEYEISCGFDTLVDTSPNVQLTTHPPEVKTVLLDNEYPQCSSSINHQSPDSSHFTVKTEPPVEDHNMQIGDILSDNVTSDIVTHYDVTQNIATHVIIKAESPLT